MAIERRIRTEVWPILLGQIIELIDRPIRLARIEPLRVGVAPGVENHGLPERVVNAVVEEGLAQGDVSQGRGAEESAIVLMFAQVRAQRATKAEIEIGGVGIG